MELRCPHAARWRLHHQPEHYKGWSSSRRRARRERRYLPFARAGAPEQAAFIGDHS